MIASFTFIFDCYGLAVAVFVFGPCCNGVVVLIIIICFLSHGSVVMLCYVVIVVMYLLSKAIGIIIGIWHWHVMGTCQFHLLSLDIVQKRIETDCACHFAVLLGTSCVQACKIFICLSCYCCHLLFSSCYSLFFPTVKGQP